MNAARKNVVAFRALPDDLLAKIREHHDVVSADPRRADEQIRFRDALRSAHGLIGSSFRLSAEDLSTAPALQVVSSISVGVDNYDLPYMKQRGIVLCHTPGVLTETTADTVFALLMATSRRLVELSNHVREARWTRNIGDDLFGWDVHGKTLGVLGFGRIGQAVARRAALGFAMPVVFYDPFDVPVPPPLAGHAVGMAFDDVLRRADIIALTLPLSDETRGLMGAREFAAMKPGAIFVNGSRGAIVQETALLDVSSDRSFHFEVKTPSLLEHIRARRTNAFQVAARALPMAQVEKLIGQLNPASGYGEWPRAEALIEHLIEQRAAPAVSTNGMVL